MTSPMTPPLTTHNIQTTIKSLKAVIFDMDGTLTNHYIDFKEMRRRVGISPEQQGNILNIMSTWSLDERQSGEREILKYEGQCLERMQLRDGCTELLLMLKHAGLRLGLISLNTSAGIGHFVDILAKANPEVKLEACVDRDTIVNGHKLARKPDPAPFLHICDVLGVDVSEAMMVGDHHVDIACGHAAGAALCVLISDANPTANIDPSDIVPDVSVNSLVELKNMF